MNREKWVDEIKGIAIVMVVLGHACTPGLCEQSAVANFIYFFVNAIHMPIFFYLAGRFFKRNKVSFRYVVRKFNKLLIPYIGYSIFVYLVIFICKKNLLLNNVLERAGYTEKISIKTSLVDILLCSDNIDKHLWFIYCLFFIYVIHIILTYLNNEKLLRLIMAILLIMGTFRLYENSTFCNIAYYYFFFAAGERKWLDNKRSINSCKKSLLLFFVILSGYAVSYYMQLDTIKLAMRLLCGIQSVKCFMLLRNIKLNNRVQRVFAKLGEKSFYIYLFHQPFITSGTALMASYFFPVEFSIVVATCVGIGVPMFFVLRHEKVFLRGQG